MKRVLVTGASGLLGGRLAALLAARFDVVAAVHESAAPEGLRTVRLELLDPGSIEAALAETKPDVVVHSAALADADACEREPERARRVNLEATATLARLFRGRLIVISTDLVLGGPQMVYARTKLEAEEAALALCPGSAVVRVALVHGRGHGRRATASEAIAWALRAGRTLRLFSDQFRTPVDPESVAEALRALIDGSASGRFELGGPERLSRHELGMRVSRVLGLPAERIEPITQADLPLPAPRPKDVALDSGRAARELGYRPRPLEDGIRDGRPAPP